MTKRQSSVLYGIAIMMMLYHHLFCLPGERLHVEYFSVLEIFGGGQIEQKLAWFCRLCVGIYACISGYGLCKGSVQLPGPEKGVIAYLYSQYTYSLRRILRFMGKYWIVCAIFLPIGYGMHVFPFDFSLLLKHLLGLSSKYNGEWWYVKQYIFMVFTVPWADLLFRQIVNPKIRNIRLFGLFTALTLLYTYILLFYFHKQALIYCLIFGFGFLAARFQLFEKGIRYCGKRKTYIGVFGLIICLIVRVWAADTAGYAISDIVIAPLFIFCVCLITPEKGNISDCFACMGKFSVYMWLTHTFYCYTYFQPLITASRVSTIMYLTLFVVSLLTAFVLSILERSIVSIGKFLVKQMKV